MIGSPELALDGPVFSRLAAPVVEIRGPDARRFANGMFTNNVRDLPIGGANRHAVVDDRGRIAGFLDLLCLSDDVFLAVLDGIDPERFEARFAPYIVFDDVTFVAPAVPWVGGTVQGQGHRAALAAAGIPLPEAGRFAEGDGIRVFGTRGWPDGGVTVLVAASDGPDPIAALGDHTTEIDGDGAEVLRVLAGVPRFPDDTGPKGLPHELGLRVDHLNFDKGCYLGQESINRIDVMGTIRRKLVAIMIDGATPDQIAAAEVHLDKRVGQITSAVALDADRVVALAVLKEPAHTPGSIVSVVAEAGPFSGRVQGLPLSATSL